MAVYSDIIKELRKDRGVNQNDMAKHFGISQSVYSDYETGKRRMSVEMLVELAYLLDASVDYILGISTEAKPISRRRINPYPQRRGKAAKNKN